MSNKTATLQQPLAQRIMILDGTMIQSYKLDEQDFRGSRFADSPCDVKGNNDLRVLSKPEIIREIHDAYLAAGADILETNTFNATTITMAEYEMAALLVEINFEAAKLARACADAWTAKTPAARATLLACSVPPTAPARSLQTLTMPCSVTSPSISWWTRTANRPMR